MSDWPKEIRRDFKIKKEGKELESNECAHPDLRQKEDDKKRCESKYGITDLEGRLSSQVPGWPNTV